MYGKGSRDGLMANGVCNINRYGAFSVEWKDESISELSKKANK